MSDDIILNTRWSSSSKKDRFTVENPSTRECLAIVQGAGIEQVQSAVAAAREAQLSWAVRSARERGRYLQEVARILRAHADELAALEASETGKPLAIARHVDMETCIESFDYFGSLIGRLPLDAMDLGPLISQSFLEPFGVVAGIIPFNWPPIHFGAKVAPALAVGNAIVLKPGEQAPLSIIRLTELVANALPDDVIQVVPGLGDIGAALVAHPSVRKISFTGSPETGKKVLRAAADNHTPTLLELGGKNPFIVFDDADIETAVVDALEGGFFNNGCACTAASRVLVQRPVYETFLERFSAAVEALRVGDSASLSTHVGPMVSQEHQQKVLDYIEIGVAEGARLIAQAPLPTNPELQKGYFVAPTVFADVSPDMRIAREEIFGPVVCVLPFDHENDAVSISNDCDFALVAGVYSQDSERALRVGRRIEAGVVFINNYNRALLGTPFGGTKASGYGREHFIDTLREFGYVKTMRIPSGRGTVQRWNLAAK